MWPRFSLVWLAYLTPKEWSVCSKQPPGALGLPFRRVLPYELYLPTITGYVHTTQNASAD